MTPEQFMNMMSGTQPQEPEPKPVNTNGDSLSYWNATTSVGAVVEAPASTTAPQEEIKQEPRADTLSVDKAVFDLETAISQLDQTKAVAEELKIPVGNIPTIPVPSTTGQSAEAVVALAKEARGTAETTTNAIQGRILESVPAKVMELAAGAMALAEDIIVPHAQKFSSLAAEVKTAVGGWARSLDTLERAPDGSIISSAFTAKSAPTNEYLATRSELQIPENAGLPKGIPGLGQGQSIGRMS